MIKKFVSKTDEMDQQRLISLSHEKCARVASEHRREMLVTAAGAATLQQKKTFGDFPSELRQVTGKESMKTRG